MTNAKTLIIVDVDTIDNTTATDLELDIMEQYDCVALEETRDTIAKAVTYERLLKSLLPGAVDFMRNEYYKGAEVPKDFIHSEAREMVEEQAHMFVYEWETQLDDYSTMTEEEIRAVIFN